MGFSSKSNEVGFGCLILFALPFLLGGLFGTFLAWRTATEHSAMKSWVEVPATIKQVEFKESRRRKKGRSHRSHHTAAVYEYEYEGSKHTSERVSLHDSGDNVGSFQRDIYNELNQYFQQKKPFRAFVDPRDPSKAVLYRDLRWELLAGFTAFAAGFSAVGIGMIAAALAQARRTGGKPVKNAPASQPWLARSDWASGRLQQSGGVAIAVPVLAAVIVFWWLGIGPLLTKLPEILPPADNSWAWLTLLFPAIGLVLIGSLVHQILRKQKFGDSTLQLAKTPGVIGGQLVGVVRIDRDVRAENGYRLKLSCVEHVKSGKNTKEEVLWQDEQVVTQPMRDAVAGAIALPVLFAIPYKSTETSHGDSKRKITWKLEVSASLPGVDYKTRFDVPVFKTPESRPDFQLDKKLSTDFSAAPSNDLLLRDAGIVKESLPGAGVRLTFPAARNLGMAIGITAFLAIWFGAIWFMLYIGAPKFFPIIFALFGLLIVWIAVDLWFYRSIVEANADGLAFRGSYFGIGRRHTWKVAEIKRFETSDSMSSGTNVWKHVDVLPTAGKKRTIGRMIPGKLATQAVIDELNAALRRTDVV